MTGARDGWAEALRRVSEDGAGVVSMLIVRPSEMLTLMADAIAGSAKAERFASVAAQVVARIEGAPRDKSALCGCCPRHLRGKRFAVVAVVPHRDDPQEAFGFGVCPRCGHDYDAIERAAVETLRRIWPDLKRLDVHPTAEGRA